MRGNLKTSMKRPDFGKDCRRVTDLQMRERNGLRISGGRWRKLSPSCLQASLSLMPTKQEELSTKSETGAHLDQTA